jgi:hypothetical protein
MGIKRNSRIQLVLIRLAVVRRERWKGYDQSHGHRIADQKGKTCLIDIPHGGIVWGHPLHDKENQAKGGDVVTISILMNIKGPNHMGLKPSLVMIGTQRPTVAENVLFSSVSNLMVIGMSRI